MHPEAGPGLSIIDRYIIKESTLTLLAVSSVLLLIISGNVFVRLLAYATEGKIPVAVVLPLLGLGTVKALILLLPLALLLAIMLTLGRLYRDSEMVALQSCGIGTARLYRPLLLLTLPIVIILTGLVMFVSPWSIRMSEDIKHIAQERADIGGLAAGSFVESSRGDVVVFVESTDKQDGNTAVSNIFIHKLEKGEVSVETAAKGVQRKDRQTGEAWLVLEDGHRYEGIPGKAEFRILSFGRHEMLIPEFTTAPARVRTSSLPTTTLLTSDKPPEQAELQWRISVPVSAILLVLLALPLSYTTPRQGRYAKLAVAIVIYAVYANLGMAAVKWISRGIIPPSIGMWWLHAALGVLILLILVKQSGFRAGRRSSRRRQA